jgi:hypothetical protein
MFDNLYLEYSEKGDTLQPLILKFAAECALREFQANQERIKLNRTKLFLDYTNVSTGCGSKT